MEKWNIFFDEKTGSYHFETQEETNKNRLQRGFILLKSNLDEEFIEFFTVENVHDLFLDIKTAEYLLKESYLDYIK